MVIIFLSMIHATCISNIKHIEFPTTFGHELEFIDC